MSRRVCITFAFIALQNGLAYRMSAMPTSVRFVNANLKASFTIAMKIRTGGLVRVPTRSRLNDGDCIYCDYLTQRRHSDMCDAEGGLCRSLPKKV